MQRADWHNGDENATREYMQNAACLGGDAVIERALLGLAPYAKAFIGFSAVTAIAQALPADPSGMGAQVERLGIIGMLAAGNVVLWRMLWTLHAQHKLAIREKDDQLQRKDDQVLVMAKAQTESLITMTNVNAELRNAVLKGQDDLLKEVRHSRGH